MVEEDFRLWTLKATKLCWNRYMRNRGGVQKLQNIVKDLAEVKGDIVELGSWRGGTAMAMAAAAQMYSPEKTVHAFDTFAGMPQPEKLDKHKKGEFQVSFDEVKMDALGLDNLKFVQGNIVDTVPPYELEAVSLLFLDCDLYRPHVVGLEKFVPLMTEGSVVVIEDYFTHDCPGVRVAIAEKFGGWVPIERYHDFPVIRIYEDMPSGSGPVSIPEDIAVLVSQ